MQFFKNNFRNASDDIKTMLNCSHSTMVNEYYNQMLASYIDVCVNIGMLEEACAVLDTRKAQRIHPEVYNIAVRGCSALVCFLHIFAVYKTVIALKNNKSNLINFQGNWKMLEKVMKLMKRNNVPHTCQTYALYLNCLTQVSNQVNSQKIYTVLTKLKNEVTF